VNSILNNYLPAMTNTTEEASTSDAAAAATIPVGEVIAAAQDLARGGRWHRAMSLLDATTTTDGPVRARLALAAAQAALEGNQFAGAGQAPGRLRTAEQICATTGLDSQSRWDLAFLRLRHEYFGQILSGGSFRPGPEGKDPNVLADLRRRAGDLRELADDDIRRGWADMYLGLIADNLYGERDAAPAHYQAALLAGEAGDDLLACQALRHLGDHDHDHDDHQSARERWARATTLAARAGSVPGTLSQQMLLAVLARDTGDEAGASALAGEIARWAAALGAISIQVQATSFLAGTDPTAPPENDS
jgi:hypothetical protein